MTIQFSEMIDLSHRISENMPHWPGDPGTKIDAHATVAQDGYQLNTLTIGEHSGTHIGAPAHFSVSGRRIDAIPPEHLVAPAINLHIKSKAEKDRDYLVTKTDINEWESQHGRIDDGAVLLLQTGWSRLWNSNRYLGKDEGGLHFPGISLQAVRFLTRERKIIGLGIDTAGIDGGQSMDFAANRHLAQNELFHLENLNMQKLSVPRLTIVIGALPIKNGSGSPCRVFGLL